MVTVVTVQCDRPTTVATVTNRHGDEAAPGRSVLLAPLARGERKASFGARAKSAFALLLEKVTKPPADAGEKEFDESDN